jgi:hypothetical protein
MKNTKVKCPECHADSELCTSGASDRFWLVRMPCQSCGTEMVLRCHEAGPNIVANRINKEELPTELRSSPEQPMLDGDISHERRFG